MPKIFIAILVLFYTNNTFAQCEVEISPDGPVNLCEGGFVELTTTVTAVELSVDQQQLLYLGGESARNLPDTAPGNRLRWGNRRFSAN
jgi:hypothetical protein